MTDTPLQHPVNVRHIDRATLGARVADRAAEIIGSWNFLIIQTFLIFLWVLANALLLKFHGWDPYPFVLLNLLFSVQAAYTGPVLLLAGNRQAQKDRATLEHEAAETQVLCAAMIALLRDTPQDTALIETQLLQLIGLHGGDLNAAQK